MSAAKDAGASPPRLARALMAWVCPAEDRRFVLSDLDEEFEARVAEHGARAARRWYRGQVARSVPPCLVRRLRLSRRPADTRTFGRGEGSAGVAPGVEGFLIDLVQATRFLLLRPLFTAVGALSIALGVGATTTVFSVANRVLFTAPAGIADADRVVEVGRTMGGRGFDTFSFPELRDFQAEAVPLAHVAGIRPRMVSFMSGGDAEQVLAAAVSQSYFDVMGVRPAAGRFFRPEEDVTPGAHAVAVVSWRFWQDRLGGGEDAIGRTIDINRQPFMVVGVTPPEFRGHVLAVGPELWIPITMHGTMQAGFRAFDERRASWLTIVARLAPGATVEQADAAVRMVMARHTPEASDPRNQRSAGVKVLGAVPGGGRPVVAAFLGMLGGLVVIVLLVTAANVGGMLLARGAAREREIAIRLALGAGRGRVVRQLLLESVLVFVAGGALGVAIATWTTGLAPSIDLPVPIPLDLDMRPDGRVLAAGLGLSLLTGLLFGLAPAIQAGGTDLNGALKAESRRGRSRGGRMRRLFVVSQIGLSLVLLLTAGLFLRSLQRAAHIDTGFDPAGVHILNFDLSRDGYDAARGAVFLTELRERVLSMPGVTAASFATDLPLDLGRSESPVHPEGWQNDDGRPWVQADFNVVDAGYFETLGIAVRRGRAFGPGDRVGALPVAVVNRTMVERIWPDTDPIGMRIRLSEEGDLLTVIGVVDDVKNSTLMDAPVPMAYLPLGQNYRPAVTLAARSTAAGGAFAPRLRTAVLEADPRLALSPVQSLVAYTSIGVLPQRLAAGITGALGLLAVLLAAIGVYGVIALAVVQRTREIGVRMALGAHPGDVVRLVVRDGVRLAAPGLVFGLAAGAGLAFLIRSFILGVAPADPLAFGAAVLVLLAAVLAASALPARRAARLEPTRALRTE